VAGFPPRQPEFESSSGHVGFVVDKVALGQGFSEYFGFPCQFLFHRLLHTHHHHHLPSGSGTRGQVLVRSTKWTQFHPTARNQEKELMVTFYGILNTDGLIFVTCLEQYSSVGGQQPTGTIQRLCHGLIAYSYLRGL
jgi:hypothetical protein